MEVGNRECPIWLAYVAFSNKAIAERGAYIEEHYEKPTNIMFSVTTAKRLAVQDKLNKARAAYGAAISSVRSYRSWVFDNDGTPEEPLEKQLVDELEEELNAACEEEDKLYPLYEAAKDAMWKLVEAKLSLMRAEEDAEWALEEKRMVIAKREAESNARVNAYMARMAQKKPAEPGEGKSRTARRRRTKPKKPEAPPAVALPGL